MVIPSKMAATPLLRIGERRDETPPTVKVIEERTAEGWRIVVVSRPQES